MGNYFYGCTSLVDFEPHKNLKSVALDALEGSGWENAQPDGALAFGRICYGYKGDITNLVIPEGVSIVEAYAFLGCEQIKTVTFGPDVEEIGLYAFQNCVNLETMTCDTAVSIIRAGAFKGCSSLKEADFSECTISTIGYESFSGCTSLTSVTLSNSLEKISEGLFAECSALTDIVIPDSVTEIEKGAFLNCVALHTAIVGRGVTAIGEDAFSNCATLQSITIGESVTGKRAFHKCDCILGMICKPQTPPVVEYLVLPETATIYVPQKMTRTYKKDMSWSDYAKQIKRIKE